MARIKLVWPFAFLVSLLISSSVWAAQDKITLTGEAQGEAQIQDGQKGKKQVNLKLDGLKSNSLYTVWLVNEKPKMDMAGLGTGDFSFRSDAKGNAQYSAEISQEELKKWQLIEIAYHPDSNPKNMKNYEIVAKGTIPAVEEVVAE